MHIPIRVLKTKLRPDLAPCRRPFFELELKLFAPALEPFLLMRVSTRNLPEEVYSVQFARDGSDEFHYMNFEFEAQEEKKSVIERVVVADMPLTPNSSWRVVKCDPDGVGEEIGVIRRDPFGLWRYVPCAAEKRSLPNDGARARPMQFALIGGAPKSGTTWVERILNSHPDALVTGENLFFEWPGRSPLYAVLEAAPPPYFAFAVSQTPPFKSQAALFYAGRAEKTLAQIGEIARARYVADKSPGYAMFLPEILDALPDWKYIHCVRHPLDIAVSRFFHERALLRDTPELSEIPEDDALRAHVVSFDKDTAEKGDMFTPVSLLDSILDMGLKGSMVFDMAVEHANIHIVRYEELLADFRHTADRLFGFCGLDVDKEFLAWVEAKNSFKRFSGGRKKGQEAHQEFFRKGIACDHLTYMTQNQIDYSARRILAHCEWYRSYFPGYGDDKLLGDQPVRQQT